MERNIPHVLDIFSHSPGVKRRANRDRREDQLFSSKLKEQQKNPGSDSAVSLGSSDEDDNERNISKYFDYLDNDPSIIVKSDSKTSKHQTKNLNKCSDAKSPPRLKTSTIDINKNNDLEKEFRHIERHLSMKKTIRKKMMRDLQQAFVEDASDLKQDPEKIAPEKKSNINIENLTISKKRLSKSEHSFLDMLKDEESQLKDRKSRNYEEFKETKESLKEFKGSAKRNSKSHHKKEDEDSGNDSPTREPSPPSNSKSKKGPTKPCQAAQKPLLEKEEKKSSFWKRLTGKSKNKR